MNTRHVTLIIFTLLLLAVVQPVAVSALTSGEAKQTWYEAKEQSRTAQAAHRQAKIVWAGDKTPEHNQQVIDTGKEVLSAALDEAEAWLVWKNLEVEENPEIPAHLREEIRQDVEANLATIDDLREDVDAIENRLELGVTFLKMVGRYVELLTDVARNSGKVWVHIANGHADTIEEYEAQLRDAAEGMPDNGDILDRLDMARTELHTARENIGNAELEYAQVELPGQPLIKFSNGNNYLKIARGNMLSAQGYLRQAFNLMVV